PTAVGGGTSGPRRRRRAGRSETAEKWSGEERLSLGGACAGAVLGGGTVPARRLRTSWPSRSRSASLVLSVTPAAPPRSRAGGSPGRRARRLRRRSPRALPARAGGAAPSGPRI